MRFFEIATPTIAKIVATKRFLKNAQLYLRGGYAGLADTFRDFLDFKVQHPNDPWGAKDLPFAANKALRGIWHAHLVHGKVIVIYRPISGVLYLYDMNEHTAFDTPALCSALGAWIDGLKPNAFEPYAGPKPKMQLNVGEPFELEAKVVLPDEHTHELNALFYEMAQHDRDILDTALQGNIADLMEFMALTVPEKPATILEAFGGVEGLKKHIRDILKQMGG